MSAHPTEYCPRPIYRRQVTEPDGESKTTVADLAEPLSRSALRNSATLWQAIKQNHRNTQGVCLDILPVVPTRGEVFIRGEFRCDLVQVIG